MPINRDEFANLSREMILDLLIDALEAGQKLKGDNEKYRMINGKLIASLEVAARTMRNSRLFESLADEINLAVAKARDTMR